MSNHNRDRAEKKKDKVLWLGLNGLRDLWEVFPGKSCPGWQLEEAGRAEHCRQGMSKHSDS